MIFVTVGTELPFDRLVKAVDMWAGDTRRTNLFAQIGEGGWKPVHMQHTEFLDPREFASLFCGAELVIAHAGMGTILSALYHGKPLIVMPRLASKGEQRNEHQLATARRLSDLGRINVAFDESELRRKLDEFDQIKEHEPISEYASNELQAAIRDFMQASIAKSATVHGLRIASTFERLRHR